ncbi:MAG: hypothetical protein KBD37_06315, partial [Burkholderiales bacterium]|nr:hypothetical protein [Burkholderiales bacterium]
MKRLLAYVVVACAVFLVLTGCNGSGGSSRGTSNTAYGQLISGGNAPSNPLLASVGGDTTNMTISMENLNLFFESTVICGAIPSRYNYYALFCGENANYVNNNPEMFDLSQSETVQNYVLTNAESAGVAGAKFDMLTYTTQGASYLFAGQSTSKETVSGLMILPTNESGNLIDESKIQGVVLYFHPTVLSKTGVPSGYGNVDGIDYASTFTFQFDLASIFVSNGYIVLAADYPGQGLDVNPVHPY